MPNGGWEALGAVAAVLALLGAFVGYVLARPRVTVRAYSAMLIGDERFPQGVSAVFVEVTNRGRAAAPISGVAVVGGGLSATPFGGPPLPLEVSPHGGRRVWPVRYDELIEQLRSVPTPRVRVRASVQIGDRTRSSRQGIEVLAPGEVGHLRLVERVGLWQDRLLRQQVQFEWGIDPRKVDLKGRTYVLSVRNYGGGLARDVRVFLARSQDSMRDAVDPSLPVIKLGVLVGHRSRHVRVPLVSGQPSQEATWWVMTSKGRQMGISALTVEQARELVEGLPIERTSGRIGPLTKVAAEEEKND